jgi:hypothetical protein
MTFRTLSSDIHSHDGDAQLVGQELDGIQGCPLLNDFGNLTHIGVSTFNSVAFADAVSV